jgi:hypothetical protein
MVLELVMLVFGFSSHYAPGRMAEVIEARQAHRTHITLPVKLGEFDGYGASVRCDDIGNVVFARPVGSKEWSSILIVDCANPNDVRPFDGLSGQAWMLKYGFVLETGYPLAEEWGCVGRACEIEMLTSSLWKIER